MKVTLTEIESNVFDSTELLLKTDDLRDLLFLEFPKEKDNIYLLLKIVKMQQKTISQFESRLLALEKRI